MKSLKTLLKLGASAITEDYKGRSPLFVAAEQGNGEIRKRLDGGFNSLPSTNLTLLLLDGAYGPMTNTIKLIF